VFLRNKNRWRSRSQMTDDAWDKSIRPYEIAQMEGRWKRRGINKSIRKQRSKQMRGKKPR
jgi:hypothetical protein